MIVINGRDFYAVEESEFLKRKTAFLEKSKERKIDIVIRQHGHPIGVVVYSRYGLDARVIPLDDWEF